MRKIDLRELQLIELDILNEFAEFCDKNKLNYFLDSGTLIGAIRHKGFIPWDDDIDVCFLRDDYIRFVQLMKERKFKLTNNITLELEADSPYPYLKLVDNRTVMIEYPDTNPLKTGVYIDIFPKDDLLSQNKREVIRAKRIQRLNLISWVGFFTRNRLLRKGGVRNILVSKIISVLIPNPEKYKRTAIHLAQKNNGKNGRFVSSLVCSGMVGCVDKNCFEQRIDVSFEGHTFKAPAGYDEYLKSLYKGDYMVLPPPEKRVAHKTIVYWKEEVE